MKTLNRNLKTKINKLENRKKNRKRNQKEKENKYIEKTNRIFNSVKVVMGKYYKTQKMFRSSRELSYKIKIKI